MAIYDFYRGQEILITGSTGFIGMALIEKLLRSCPDIKSIYVLMRAKRGQTIEQRLAKQMDDALYGRVREKHPELLQKVIPIAGDCTEIGLGISAGDLARLSNLTIIYHAAANVRFDDVLSSAVILNMRGTLELLKLAEKMPKLKSFVHVSTTYSNPDYSILEERVYPPNADWRTLIKLAEHFDEDTLNVLCAKYIGVQPNTYTFTKGLAEQIVNDYRHKLPVIIFRPSIVVSALKEPYGGWFANFNGPLGITVAAGFGLCSTVYGARDAYMDLIPIDIVVRALILTAYKRAVQKEAVAAPDRDEVPVINCASSIEHSVTNKEYADIGIRLSTANPFSRAIWTPTMMHTNCYYWYCLRIMILDLPRSVLIDLLLVALGYQPFVLKTQRRLFDTNMMLHYFVDQTWDFKTEKFAQLDQLAKSKEELAEFGNLLPIMVFEEAYRLGLMGVKRFKVNEPAIATSAAIWRMRIYSALSYVMRAYLFWILYKYSCALLLAKYNALWIID